MLFRVFGWLQETTPEPLRVPRDRQGGGRHDNPERYTALYLAREPVTAIAEAIVALGKGLKLNLIAEGVETESQRNFLRTLGCHVMQGYLFNRPQPASEIPDILSRYRRPAA